jgi:hypothetical protein
MTAFDATGLPGMFLALWAMLFLIAVGTYGLLARFNVDMRLAWSIVAAIAFAFLFWHYVATGYFPETYVATAVAPVAVGSVVYAALSARTERTRLWVLGGLACIAVVAVVAGGFGGTLDWLLILAAAVALVVGLSARTWRPSSWRTPAR